MSILAPQSINQLGTVAAEVMMRAFADYARSHAITITDYDAACELLRSRVRVYLPIALADAKEAMDCGMTQVAEATFKATLMQAGIEAAQLFNA